MANSFDVLHSFEISSYATGHGTKLLKSCKTIKYKRSHTIALARCRNCMRKMRSWISYLKILGNFIVLIILLISSFTTWNSLLTYFILLLIP